MSRKISGSFISRMLKFGDSSIKDKHSPITERVSRRRASSFINPTYSLSSMSQLITRTPSRDSTTQRPPVVRSSALITIAAGCCPQLRTCPSRRWAKSTTSGYFTAKPRPSPSQWFFTLSVECFSCTMDLENLSTSA